MSMRTNYTIHEDRHGAYVIFISPQDEQAFVNHNDAIRLNLFQKCISVHRYQRSKYLWAETRSNKKREANSVHRMILNPPDYMQVDHIDHNGLNNRRHNLRLATRSENAKNQRLQNQDKSSKFKGVTWRASRNKWIAQIGLSGIRTHLGLFVKEIDAAIAYNRAATKHFGEFALLNKVREDF